MLLGGGVVVDAKAATVGDTLVVMDGDTEDLEGVVVDEAFCNSIVVDSVVLVGIAIEVIVEVDVRVSEIDDF